MKRKILIVEDDADLRRALLTRLKAHGYDVVVAADGAAAVSAARTERPDLVLLDLGLPVGDGFSVMQRLGNLQVGARAQILVMSARDSERDRARALELGAIAYLVKPFDNALLLATLDTALPPAEAGSPEQPRPTLLVVEDDADTRRGFELRLRSFGCDVVTAEDASTALTVARRSKVDLILLDLGLPGGDGIQLLERIRKNPALDGTPVVVVSARDALVHEPRAREAGAAAYLQKPIDNEKLRAAITEALGPKLAS